MPTGSHVWNFFRVGGFDQVRLDSGADLLELAHLDQKLWVALACPTTGVEFDTKTLGLIDTDQDGRIRASELIAAIQWAGSLLKNPDELVKNQPRLPLAAIKDSTPEGALLLATARQVLTHLGQPERLDIGLEETEDPAKIFAKSRFNGDGIITEASSDDPLVVEVIQTIIKHFGAEVDRSGKPGTNKDKADKFFAAATNYVAWASQGEQLASISGISNREAAFAAFRAVEKKINDYFGRCRWAAFDSRAIGAVNRDEKEYLSIASQPLSLDAAELAEFPLALVGPGRPLPLLVGLNPAWANAISLFDRTVVQVHNPGCTELSESAWISLTSQFAKYAQWLSEKPGAEVESVGLPKLREILASSAQHRIQELLTKDLAEADKVASIGSVERLIRYRRDLHRLANNFVSFKTLYARQEPAMFQMGTLYLDERSCEMCLWVNDPARHVAMAGMAGVYLAYCDCVRRATGEKLSIVAAFTNGDCDNMMVGRNGIFYDRKGRDYDATITKIVDNPISLRQAFWSPYKKLARFIEEQVAKRAATADSAATAKLAKTAEAAAKADQVKPEEAKKIDVGTVAAMGVAVGAIGGFCSAIVATGGRIATYGPLAVVGAILGILVLISLPSMVLAYIKLRKRNLGPILDANGWAVNARAKINVPFGASLTQVRKLPPGSHRDLVDPFAEPKNPWPRRVGFILALCIAYQVLDHFGYIDKWMGTDKETASPTVNKVSSNKEPLSP